MRATYAYAEPGVIFIDRINQRNNLHYCRGTIQRDQPVPRPPTPGCMTADGPRQVAELDRKATSRRSPTAGRAHASMPAGFFATGRKPVLTLSTPREGYPVAADARITAVLTVNGFHAPSPRDWAWCERRRPCSRGIDVVLHDHRAAPPVGTCGSYGRSGRLSVGPARSATAPCKSDKAVLSCLAAGARLRQRPCRARADRDFRR